MIPGREPSHGMILPIVGDVCQECGRDHPDYMPHDMSFRYRTVVFHRTGKSATWEDALAHCHPQVREAWAAELKRRGYWDGEVTAQDMLDVRENLSALSEKWHND